MQSIPITVAAHTFTTMYSELEDRLRLIINYADFENRMDFWITRAFLLKLAPSWEEYSYRYSTGQVRGESKTAGSANIPTDSSTLAVTDKEGMLLEAVDMTYESTTGMFEIRLRSENRQAVAFLNEEMMLNLIRTIFNAAPHLQWGVSPSLLAS